MNAVIHVIHFAGIAAEKIVAEVKPVLHHLEADLVSCLRHFRRQRGAGFGASFAVHRCQNDAEQEHHNDQNGADCDDHD